MALQHPRPSSPHCRCRMAEDRPHATMPCPRSSGQAHGQQACPELRVTGKRTFCGPFNSTTRGPTPHVSATFTLPMSTKKRARPSPAADSAQPDIDDAALRNALADKKRAKSKASLCGRAVVLTFEHLLCCAYRSLYPTPRPRVGVRTFKHLPPRRC